MTARLSGSPLSLLQDAVGPVAGVPDKLARLGRALSAYTRGDLVRARVRKLFDAGVIDVEPTLLQLAVGGYDMLRFFISPAAADYYRERGISFGFHQVLRFCDDPASLTDPIGLLSEPDVIIGHLLQVVHANPIYDLQLLSMHDGGLADLESQARAIVAGSHPRQASIGAIVEEADYHQRLLDYACAFRADPRARPPRRSNVEAKENLKSLDAVFGRMDTAMRYFASLPTSLPGALHHLATAKSPLNGEAASPVG
jgi:hypothetical protein